MTWVEVVLRAVVILAAFLSLPLLVGQTAKAAADDGLFGSIFAKVNSKGVPSAGLAIVAVIMTVQVFATMSPTASEQFGKIASIAAASILAKTVRDAGMLALHETYPQYGFDRHMGYPTALHCQALEEHGASPAHRRSFGPVARQFSLL